jgi:hypothetical protein
MDQSMHPDDQTSGRLPSTASGLSFLWDGLSSAASWIASSIGLGGSKRSLEELPDGTKLHVLVQYTDNVETKSSQGELVVTFDLNGEVHCRSFEKHTSDDANLCRVLAMQKALRDAVLREISQRQVCWRVVDFITGANFGAYSGGEERIQQREYNSTYVWSAGGDYSPAQWIKSKTI